MWAEKFRPKKLEDYIGNESIIDKFRIWLQSGEIPHILLHSHSPGTGKTSAAKMLAMNVDADILYVNASDENSVDVMRDKIKNFSSTIGFKKWKIVILDEMDFLSAGAMAILRNLMESFSKTTRFILTCNYIEKVIDPIQSRCQVFHIQTISKKDIAKRLVYILQTENVSFDMNDVAAIVNLNYPDIRRVINMAQQHSVSGRLVLDKQSVIENDYTTKVITILKDTSSPKDKLATIRQLIADAKVRTFESLYRELFATIDDWAIGHVGPCLLIMAEAQYKDAFVVAKDMNCAAMFMQIINEMNQTN